MDAAAPFETSVGFLVSQLGVLAKKSWVQVLAERDLTPNHHAILLTLHASGPLGVGELSEVVLVDARNMGPLLATLEQRGIIDRVEDPADRRRRVIALTQTGEETAAELGAATASIEADLLEPLTANQRRALLGMLRTLWRHAKQPPYVTPAP